MVRFFAVASNSCLVRRSLIVFFTIIDESEILVNFGIKRGVRKLTQSFFLVEVGQPNKDCTACVDRFNNYVFALFSLLNADHSFEERLEIWCYD